ncbi:hypothetical protein RB597_005112 [Gaeumannomyces tritici]
MTSKSTLSSSSRTPIGETSPLLRTPGLASRMEERKTPAGRGGQRPESTGAAGDLSDDELEPSTPRVDMSEEHRSEVERRLVRKLDMLLLPPLWLLYVCNYLDRNNIAQARLSTFERDLGLVGNQFNVAVSILNVGYMVMQLPSNMMLARTRPSLYIPAWVALWSCVSAATAAANSFGHLVAIRFFLGFVEAPFAPGAIYLLSCWYPRRELATRQAVMLTGLPLATAFSGLIAAGVFASLEGARGLAGWQWLFVIEGAASLFVAFLSLVLLPDFPGQKRWGVMAWLLTDEEEAVAIERMKRDRVSLPAREAGVLKGLMIAVKDVRTWIFVFMTLAGHSAYGFINFFPTIVRGFKLGSNTLTLILTAPPYLAAAVVSLLLAISSDRRDERGWHISIPQAVACVGFAITAATVNGPARYAAAFLYVCGTFTTVGIVFAWASSTLGETPEERACAIAIVSPLSQLGNIWSPYFFPSSDGPRFLMANLLMLFFSALVVAICLGLKALLRRANERLKEEKADAVLYTL